ncbi:hypothetical protein RB620_24640 [Paenibacillus sp. LHD-117]|uniref:DUF6573 family protein n=1 Tax=Paenibacillus sp. LHD-117 TaxID=3071412 RepID=UPI0027DFCCC4|nr:DUF6573 family protein [Paenibacillus sp. LHD-117]MDQ6422625.1 hypothetical protein [Paenibacillus sp. LHD-117]
MQLQPIYISKYTRADAISDGTLIDVTDMAKEAGFKVPVALTSALWSKCVEPLDADRKRGQDEKGRLWDILTVLFFEIRRSKSKGHELRYSVRFQMGSRLKLVQMKAHIGPGDLGEPVFTIMLPEED